MQNFEGEFFLSPFCLFYTFFLKKEPVLRKEGFAYAKKPFEKKVFIYYLYIYFIIN